MKTMWPSGYHQNGFVVTHPLGQYDAWLHISDTNQLKSAHQVKQGT